MKVKTMFVCSNCGNSSIKWYGKCPSCGEWNTMSEQQQVQERVQPKKTTARPPIRLVDISADDEIRFDTGINELNRVLGGGAVRGSVVLVGGEPGIGKSTLLLQICQQLCQNTRVLYVTGEESQRQLKMRAQRLGIDSQELYILAETDMHHVLNYAAETDPGVLIVDSIQTVFKDSCNSAPGSLAQVKECTMDLINLAKNSGMTIMVVGHVNKEGAIAGPKVLEHMVDSVLYFEGDRHMSYRILRAVKNRYGSTNEIGVFDMTDKGLIQVTNPSAMLLSDRPQEVPGTCVTCVIEGSRPILAEIQALVTKTSFGVPRRMSSGIDYNRAMLLLAVLEKRAGYFTGNSDTYINVTGGLRLDQPGADLAAVLAVASSYRDIAVPSDLVAFGEVGLTGEIRTVNAIPQRVAEAARMGFKKCVLPHGASKDIKEDIELIRVRNIRQALAVLGKPEGR